MIVTYGEEAPGLGCEGHMRELAAISILTIGLDVEELAGKLT